MSLDWKDVIHSLDNKSTSIRRKRIFKRNNSKILCTIILRLWKTVSQKTLDFFDTKKISTVHEGVGFSPRSRRGLFLIVCGGTPCIFFRIFITDVFSVPCHPKRLLSTTPPGVWCDFPPKPPRRGSGRRVDSRRSSGDTLVPHTKVPDYTWYRLSSVGSHQKPLSHRLHWVPSSPDVSPLLSLSLTNKESLVYTCPHHHSSSLNTTNFPWKIPLVGRTNGSWEGQK